MVTTNIESILHNMLCVTLACIKEREFAHFWLVACSGVSNLNIAIFLDTIPVINDKLCMMELLIELYVFIPLFMTLAIFQGHSSVIKF